MKIFKYRKQGFSKSVLKLTFKIFLLSNEFLKFVP